jgi:hypothetical protein
MKSVAEMTAPERARAREYFDAWKRAGPMLEEIRAQEIRAANTITAMEALDGMFTHAVQTVPMRDTSGLIQQQEIFARARR